MVRRHHQRGLRHHFILRPVPTGAEGRRLQMTWPVALVLTTLIIGFFGVIIAIILKDS